MPYVPERLLRPSQMVKEGQPVPVVPPAEKSGIPLITDTTSKTPDQVQPVSPLTQAVPATRQETGQPVAGQAGAEVTAGQPGAEAAGAGGGHEQPPNKEIGELDDDPGYQKAVDDYANWLRSASDRRWDPAKEGEDAKEIQRLEMEADIEKAVQEYNREIRQFNKGKEKRLQKKEVDIWEVIRPQKVEAGYKDPWTRLLALKKEGEVILQTQRGKDKKPLANNLALDILDYKHRENIAAWLDRQPIENMDRDERHKVTAVRIAYGLEMGLYYLTHPRSELGLEEVKREITKAKQGLDQMRSKAPEGITGDEILGSSWLEGLTSLAAFVDYAITPIEGNSVKDLDRFQGAAHRFLPTEPILQTLLRSKKVSEAVHRAGIPIKRPLLDEDGKQFGSEEAGGLDVRPDFFITRSTDPQNDYLRIIGMILNVATLKCTKTVKTTSGLLYPIYARTQIGLQMQERGYARQFTHKHILYDDNAEIVWGRREGRERFYRGKKFDADGNLIFIKVPNETNPSRLESVPDVGWFREPVKRVMIRTQGEQGDPNSVREIEQSVPDVELIERSLGMSIAEAQAKGLVYDWTGLVPDALEVRQGDILYGALFNYFFYPDKQNINRFFEYKENPDLVTFSGHVISSLETVVRAVSRIEPQSTDQYKREAYVLENEPFIGDKNLAWLLCRRGVTKELWDKLDPSLGGIRFEEYVKREDFTNRLIMLNEFWEKVQRSINNPKLAKEEKQRRSDLLQKIIANNLDWGRTVYVDKPAYSMYDPGSGPSQQKVAVLQAGNDFDERFDAYKVDDRGKIIIKNGKPVRLIRSAYDTDLTGRVVDNKGSENQSMIQYWQYYLKDESSMMFDLAGNMEPQQFGSMFEKAMKFDLHGQLKALRTLPEATDYIYRKVLERFYGSYVLDQAELVRLQGQKFAFMEMLYQYRHHIEEELNTGLHFTDARLDGGYGRFRGQRLSAMSSFKDQVVGERQAIAKEKLGRALTSEEEMKIREKVGGEGREGGELLARCLLRRAFNENSHVDMWNHFARKKLIEIFKGEGLADAVGELTAEGRDLLGDDIEGNLKPLYLLLTFMGVKVGENADDFKTEERGGNLREVSNFLRVRHDKEIQRKDRYIAKFTEISEEERERRLDEICKNPQNSQERPLLREKLNKSLESFYEGDVFQYQRKEGDFIITNYLINSYSFLDMINWLDKEVLNSYVNEVEFTWSHSLSPDINRDNYLKKLRTEEQSPGDYIWSKGKEFYWIAQGKSNPVTGINPHVRRWVWDSIISGTVIPYGEYQGEHLYDQYDTQEFRKQWTEETHQGTLVHPEGEKNPNYNNLKPGKIKRFSPMYGKRIEVENQPMAGISRGRTDCLGWGTRKLEADWTESYPINNMNMALTFVLGYFSIHKQQMVAAELADADYASAHPKYKGNINRVTFQDRNSWDYMSYYIKRLGQWGLATVSPDLLEGIISDMSQLGSDPVIGIDPKPVIEYMNMLGLAPSGVNQSNERVTAFRRDQYEIGLKKGIHPPRVFEGELIVEHADQAKAAAAKQRVSLLGATGEGLIGIKGAGELINFFSGINFASEIGNPSKHRLINVGRALIPAGGGMLLQQIAMAGLPALPFSGWLITAPVLAGLYGAYKSFRLGADVNPQELFLFTSLGSLNTKGVPKLIQEQNGWFKAYYNGNKLVYPFMTHNRRFIRAEYLIGKPGDAKGGQMSSVGAYASFISPKFIEEYLKFFYKFLGPATKG